MPKSKSKSKKTETEAAVPALSRKEQVAIKRKAQRDREEAVTFSIFAIFGSIVIGALLFFVGGVKAAAGGAVGTFLIAFSYKYPRKALWAFLIYMPFSGTVVYGLAGGNALLQLAKDVFYFPALVALIQECRQNRKPIFIPKGLMPSLGIVVVLCLLTLLFVNGSQAFPPPPDDPFNPPRPENPIAMGILGFKVLLGYVPLIFCAYYLIRDKKTLLFAMRTHVVLALVCCGLAFIQYMMLQTGKCQVAACTGDECFKASLGSRCFVGGALLFNPEFGVIRLPGTFVAPWQWGWFLISNAFINFASAFSEPSLFWRPVSLVSMASVFVLSVISGQRIALALVPVATVILLVMTGQVTNLKRFIPIGVGLVFILGGLAVANPQLVQERVDSFVGRWNASPPDAFIRMQFEDVVSNVKGFLGNGLGRATNATRAFGNVRLIETYYPKLIYEIGIFGMIAFLVVVTVLTYLTFKAYRSVRDRNLRSYGASLWVFVLFISYNTYYYPLDVDPVAVYYWFFAGVILRLPVIDREERLKTAALEPQTELKPKKGKQQRLKRKTLQPT
jgi:hypothetical protein